MNSITYYVGKDHFGHYRQAKQKKKRNVVKIKIIEIWGKGRLTCSFVRVR